MLTWKTFFQLVLVIWQNFCKDIKLQNISQIFHALLILNFHGWFRVLSINNIVEYVIESCNKYIQ